MRERGDDVRVTQADRLINMSERCVCFSTMTTGHERLFFPPKKMMSKVAVQIGGGGGGGGRKLVENVNKRTFTVVEKGLKRGERKSIIMVRMRKVER